MKRHQILGRELFEPLDVTIKLLDEGIARAIERTAPGCPQQQFIRLLHLDKIVFFAVLEHLGYSPIDNLRSRIDSGVDRAVEYFWGDWWKGDEEDAIAMDKSRPDRVLQWYGGLSHGLLLGGLAGRWDDVARICSWFDATIEAEYQAGMIEDEYMQLFLCIASHLSPQPMPGAAQVLENVRKCRTKRPRLLLAAWESAVAGNQPAFDKALPELVKFFLQNDAQDAPNATLWVALHASVIWLIAERNGLQFPALPEKLEAAVVRRQTIGLA
jgi:hypothetical protein